MESNNPCTNPHECECELDRPAVIRGHDFRLLVKARLFCSFVLSSPFCDVYVQFEKYSISEATHAFLVLDYNYANMSNWAIYMI